MAAFIVSFISIMAVIGHAHPESHIAAATAGLVGLGLSYSTPIIGLLSDLMTSFAETEKEMVSVERVQQVLIPTVISPLKQCKLVQCTIFLHNKVLRIIGHLLSGSTDLKAETGSR